MNSLRYLTNKIKIYQLYMYIYIGELQCVVLHGVRQYEQWLARPSSRPQEQMVNHLISLSFCKVVAPRYKLVYKPYGYIYHKP